MGVGHNFLHSMSECVPNLSDLSLGESTGAARVPRQPASGPFPKQRSGSGGLVNPSPIRKQPSKSDDNDESLPIPKLGVIGPYLYNLSDVVGDLLDLEEERTEEMCYALVDGSNVIYEVNGVLKLKQDAMDEAKNCLPPRFGAQVIVVWTQWMWDKYDFGGTKRSHALRRKQLACLFEPLRGSGTSVYFALVQYPMPDRATGYVYLPNGTKKDQPWCKLPGMWRADHLACELDDAILTALHCELTRNNRCARAVSGDRRVIKEPKEMLKLAGWVEAAYRNHGFEVVTTIVEVDVDGCASVSEPSA